MSDRPILRAFRAVAAGISLSAVVALSACAPEPEPEPVSLSVTAAAATYLEEICPVNDAWDDLDFAVDQLRLTLDAAEGTTDSGPVADAFARYQVALESLGEQSLTAADALENPDQRWPQDAARPVRVVAQSLRQDQTEAARLSRLDAVTAAAALWPQAEDSAQAAAAARAALGLPADSTAACAERPETMPSTSATPVTPSDAPSSQDSNSKGTKR